MELSAIVSCESLDARVVRQLLRNGVDVSAVDVLVGDAVRRLVTHLRAAETAARWWPLHLWTLLAFLFMNLFLNC